jgi:hypothetical protein
MSHYRECRGCGEGPSDGAQIGVEGYCEECYAEIHHPHQTSRPAQSGTAQYKGRTYRLLWMGATKFGRRAHLAFTDGTKDFWINANLIG